MGFPALLDCYAIAPPGVEGLTATELANFDIKPLAVEPGGVSFSAAPRQLYAANLHLRTASRILVRVAEFHADAFYQLERRASRIPWERFVKPERAVHFRVTSKKSRLYHAEGVAQRLEEVVATRVPGARAVRKPSEAEALELDLRTPPGVQRFVVRLLHDRCTVSADSSGALLHRRGYRVETAKAPLRETLAAALLLGSEWDGSVPLIDPMCGSGTIPIEAALLARGVPPGLNRRFAFERWPECDARAWAELLDWARQGTRDNREGATRILGSDRDAGAIEAARANAERAGVGGDIEFSQCVISAIEPPPGPGWVVTNPPYGTRIGERLRLRDLYAQLGNVLRRRCPGWHVALLSADRMLEGQTGLALEERFRTINGGIQVRLMTGAVSS